MPWKHLQNDRKDTGQGRHQLFMGAICKMLAVQSFIFVKLKYVDVLVYIDIGMMV